MRCSNRQCAFWGKLDRDAATGAVHCLPLINHCLDVAMVFRCLADLPGFRNCLEAAAGQQLSDVQCDRLGVEAFLHDGGKCNTGFVARDDPDAVDTAGHVRELAAPFYEQNSGLNVKFFDALGLAEHIGWFDTPDGLGRMLYAAISHHGRPPFSHDAKDDAELLAMARHWYPRSGRDPFVGLSELRLTACQAFPRAYTGEAPPIGATIELQHLFAGLVMLADWIGSHRGFFPFERDGDPVSWSRRHAEQAIRSIGLDIDPARRSVTGGLPSFGTIFDIDAFPRPLQSVLADPDLPPLVIAESDTGSGKTEAAILHFLSLFGAGHVDGLYFALPTRVAARELYGRVLAAMQRVFGSDCPPVLLAVPGYAHVDGVPAAQLLPPSDSLYHENDLLLHERTWAAERPKRFLAAPVAVGTIDQALMSVVQVSHAHLRYACLQRSLLVVDEVHSSDIYMRYLSRKLLSRHLAVGGRALLLSATLGSAARMEYLAPGVNPPPPEPFAEAVKKPYPAVSFPERPVMPCPAGSSSCSRRVGFDPVPLLEKPELLLPRIRDALRNGQRVLVVMNTVGRAVSLFRVADDDPAVQPHLFSVSGLRCPHHGRFARSDRELLDRSVTETLGKNSVPGAVLLIGTQTLEQSLDIDADWLITDLCPIDVLLQRIGRLHRHRRGPRPPAVCTVLLPGETDLSRLIDRQGTVRDRTRAGLGTVYEDLRVLQLTLDLIRATPTVELPRDNRLLVESATHPERLASLEGEKWSAHTNQLTGTGFAHRKSAADALVPDKHFGEFLFPRAVERRLAARLGLQSRTISLGRYFTTPFGTDTDEIVIPGHLVLGLDAGIGQAHMVKQLPDGMRIQVDPEGWFIFQYSRFGLERGADEHAA